MLKIPHYLLVCFLIMLMTLAPAWAKEVTLKEKIGQMLMIGFQGKELHPEDPVVKAILAQQIGGVVLFDYDVASKTYDHNIESPEQLKHLTKQLQDYTRESSPHAAPLLIGIDYEGGRVNRLKERFGFPKTLSAAEFAELPADEAKEVATQMAETLQKMGVNFNFAPVIDVNVNPENPVIGKIGRSFSSDPEKVSEEAAIFSKVYQDHNVLCAYKHFPGHGSSTNDSHLGFVDVTQTWQSYELNPYKTLLTEPYACPVIMTAHVVHYGLDSKGNPATLSYPIITELLREKLHFKGVVITDDMQMKAIADNYGLHEAVRLSVNAGADILLFGNQLSRPQDPKEIVDMIYDDVKTGKIRESRIDEAYQHIMALKTRLK